MTSRSNTATKTVVAPVILSAAIVALAFGGFGVNNMLALFALAVFLFVSWLLWRPRESPVLLFVVVYQWLQASIKIFHANWIGVDISNFASYGGDIELAIELSLVGIVVLAIGMRLGAGAWRLRRRLGEPRHLLSL